MNIYLASIASASSNSHVGSEIWIVILLIGICKCMKISKRETTNAKCLYSLAFLQLGWLLPNLFTTVRKFCTLPSTATMVLGGVVLIVLTCSVVLAILGLIECRQNTLYTQGKKQAIWALVLTGVLVLTIALGMINGMRGKVPGSSERWGAGRGGVEDYAFQELNFKLKHVPGTWMRVDMSSINPEITIALKDRSTSMVAMVIAENMGAVPDLELDKVIELSLGIVKKSCARYTPIGKGTKRVADIEGTWISDDIVIGANKAHCYRWYGLHAGIIYQIVVTGAVAKGSLIDSEAEKMLSRFEIIDASRLAQDHTPPLSPRTSTEFGYTIEPKENSWKKWEDFEKEIPGADYAGLHPRREIGFAIVPFLYEGLLVNADDALSAVQESLGWQVPPGHTKVVSVEEREGMKIRTLSFTLSRDGTDFDYRCIEWNGKNHALYLWFWGPVGCNGHAEAFANLQDSIKAQPLFSPPKGVSTFSSRLIDFHACCYNRLGILYLRAQQYPMAIEAFKKAAHLQPDECVFLQNTLSALEQAGLQHEALQYMTNASPLLISNPKIECLRASLLSQTDKEPEAYECYKRVFRKGYKDNEHFQKYATLLGSMEKWEELDSVFESYLKIDSSLETRLIKADTYTLSEKYEQAIQYLEALQPKSKVCPEICFRLINNHSSLGHHAEALGLSDMLITNGFKSANAYYQRASSEYSLGWYKQAKNSVEQAMKLAPNDPDVKTLLTLVSAKLGEGSNSHVKEVIEPVALPEELEGKFGPVSNLATNYESSAVILADCHVFKFDRGRICKTTRYRRLRALNQTGVSQLSTIKIRFNPLNEQLYVNALKVRNIEGKVVSEGKVDDYYVIDDRTGFESSYDKTLCVPIAHLQPGCDVEVIYTHKKLGDARAFPFERVIMVSMFPVQYMACCYLGEPSAINYKVFNGIRERTIKGGLLWEVEKPQAFAMEPLAPALETCAPFICMSDATATWKKEADEYVERLKARFEVTPAVKKLAAELTRTAQSQEEKADAVLKHIQKDYTYKPIEFGVRGVLPFSADETIHRKYGDCKDFAVLARQLFAALSIKSSLVLVDSQFDTVEAVPSLDQFDHMILYVPEKKGCRFVDLTQLSCGPYDLVPEGLAGKNAFVFEGDQMRFERIPEYAKDVSTVISKATVTLKEDKIEVHELLTFRGYCASSWRSLEELGQNDRLQWLQHLLSEYEPYARGLSVVFKDNVDERAFVLEVKYQIDHRVQKREEKSLFKLPNLWIRHYCDYTPMNNRTQAYHIVLPLKLASEVTVIAEGQKVSKRPAAAGRKHDGVQWDMSCAPAEKNCTVTFNCEFIPGQYPAAKYNSFVGVMKEAINSSAPEIELVPH